MLLLFGGPLAGTPPPPPSSSRISPELISTVARKYAPAPAAGQDHRSPRRSLLATLLVQIPPHGCLLPPPRISLAAYTKPPADVDGVPTIFFWLTGRYNWINQKKKKTLHPGGQVRHEWIRRGGVWRVVM